MSGPPELFGRPLIFVFWRRRRCYDGQYDQRIGDALIAILQGSPCRDIEIEAPRAKMPVRELEPL
jgi:hypothetical protein